MYTVYVKALKTRQCMWTILYFIFFIYPVKSCKINILFDTFSLCYRLVLIYNVKNILLMTFEVFEVSHKFLYRLSLKLLNYMNVIF